MRARGLAVAALAGALGVGACGGPSDAERVQDTVAAFVEGVGEADGERVCDTIAQDVRAEIGRDAVRSCAEEVTRSLRSDMDAAQRRRIARARRGEPRIDGDRATVAVAGVGTFTLRREDDEWSITDVPGSSVKQLLAEAYVREFNQVGTTLERTLSSLGRELTGTTDPEDIAVKLDQGAEALGEAARDLDAIDPPRDAEQAHTMIIAGVQDLASTFTTGARQARAGNLQQLVETFSGIQGSEGAAKIQEAQRSLRDKGYEVDE